MDDTISCSPTLDTDKSFHMQRQRRKCKRKCIEKEKNQQSNDHNYVQSSHPMKGFGQLVEELDNPRDQTFQVHSPSMARKTQSQLHYEMFEDVLTLADQIDCEQAARAQKQRKVLKSTEGFQTASQNLTVALNEESCESDLLGIETEFGLTKTQLFDYCDRIDQNDPSQSSIRKVDTNSTSMSIVGMILQDFCSSPEYKADELMINDAVTAAPYFRFRGQIIKTYSRHKPQNIAVRKQNRVDQPMEDDDDRVSSCSSDLSVQEDLTNSTQLPAVVLGNIDLNSSQRLCQNLLNISAFFTANTEEDYPIAPKNVKDCNNLNSAEITFESCSGLNLKPPIEPQLVAEELTFNKKYSVAFSEDISWSFDDYHWFSSQHSIQSPVNLKEPDFELEDKHISLSEFDPKSDSEKNCDNKPITEKLSTFDSSEKFSICNRKHCDDHDDKDDLWKKEANVSLKSVDWFNDDFDYDFNTEDILIKTKDHPLVSENHSRIKIDATKTECVEGTKLLRDKPASIQIEYIEEKPCTSREAIQRINDDHENKLRSDFGSHSKVHVHQGDEEFNYELSQWLLDDFAKQKCDNELDSTTKPVGFCTARNKSIHVSEAAKRKVASIVAELPDLPIKTNDDEKQSYPMISEDKLEDISIEDGIDKLGADEYCCDDVELSQWLLDDVAKQKCDNELEPPTVVGFCTAGNKNIQVSDAAKRKAALIVANLPELPEKSNSDLEESDSSISNEKIESLSCDNIELSQWLLDDFVKQKCDNELEPPTVVGFCTAGNKNIQVSDAAKRKAASIVANLPELPEKSDNDNNKTDPTNISTDRLEDISNEILESKLNEEPHEENVCDVIELSQWLLDDVGKPKCDNELKPPTVVASCTAGNKCIQVSDAAKRKAASIVSELSEFSVKDKYMIENSSDEVVDSKINEIQVEKENNCEHIELSQWLLDDVAKNCDNVLELPTVVGNTRIQVSDATKQKEASLVVELPDLPNKNSKEKLKKEITNKRKFDGTLIETSVEKSKKNNELKEERANDCYKIEMRKWSLDEATNLNTLNNLKTSNSIEIRKWSLDEAVYRNFGNNLKSPKYPKTSDNDKSKIDARINLIRWEVRSVDFSSQKNNGVKDKQEPDCYSLQRRLSLLNDITKEKTDPPIKSTIINTERNSSTNISETVRQKATSIVSQPPNFPEKTIKELKNATTTNKRKLEEINIETSVDKIMKISNAEDEEVYDYNSIEHSKLFLNGVTDHITGTKICSTTVVGNKSTHVTEKTSIVSELPVFPSKKTNNQSNEECENIPIVKKLKLNDLFTDTPLKSSLIILSKSQRLENFRTPQESLHLSQTQSSFIELSARSPLEKYTKSSVIARKNLLTLNKKRNLRNSQNDDDYIDAMENIMIDVDYTEHLEKTPTLVKHKSLNQIEINQTPRNSKVYMNSLATSTPQPLKSINAEISYDLENDFQHIKWQPEDSDLAKTLTNSATKPSPKERIERLRIYGDPPALSPITTAAISSLSANSRSFRPPGLRRRRILSKPK